MFMYVLHVQGYPEMSPHTPGKGSPMVMYCFGDSYGNDTSPLEARGNGGQISLGPMFLRVNPWR